MELTHQVATLQDEVKLLKGEIKAILKEIRSAVLTSDNPFAADVKPPTFHSVERPGPAIAADPAGEPNTQADAPPTAPAVVPVGPTPPPMAGPLPPTVLPGAPAGPVSPMPPPMAAPLPPTAPPAAPAGPMGPIVVTAGGPSSAPTAGPAAPTPDARPGPPTPPPRAGQEASQAAPAAVEGASAEPPAAATTEKPSPTAKKEPTPLRPPEHEAPAEPPEERDTPAVSTAQRWNLLTIASLTAWAEDALTTLGQKRFQLVLELASFAELLSPEVRDVLGRVAQLAPAQEQDDRPMNINECLVVLRQLEAILQGEKVSKLPRRRRARHSRVR